jgi:hypothetical protein
MCPRLARDLEFLAIAEEQLQTESEHQHLAEIAAHWAAVADELEKAEILP